MKKILILTRFKGEYEPTRLKKEALALGMEVDLVNYEQVRIGVGGDGLCQVDLGNGKELADYTYVIPRAASARGKQSMVGVKTVVLEYLQKVNEKGGEKIKILNDDSFRNFPLMGKLEQGMVLAQAGLPAIPFSSFYGKKGWKNYLDSRPELPVILKARFGSHGKGVRLVETIEKLEKMAAKFSEGTFLVQPVLKVRRWYRVLVLDGKVLGMMAHRQKDKFQTEEIMNEVKGIKPVFSEDQFDELKRICVKACDLFGCEYAGLDVAWEEEQKRWMIFEINRTAQFKWFEKAHPEINVAGELVRRI